jgi:drug/metabolite transporter (DMT)-like permease
MRETRNRTYFGLSAGLAAALGSALLFGATTPIAKQLLNGASPLLVAGLLYLGSGVGLALVRLVQDRGLSPTTLKRSDWLWLAAATASGGGHRAGVAFGGFDTLGCGDRIAAAKP